MDEARVGYWIALYSDNHLVTSANTLGDGRTIAIDGRGCPTMTDSNVPMIGDNDS